MSYSIYYSYDASRRLTRQYTDAAASTLEAHYFTYNQRDMVTQIQDVKAVSPDANRYFVYNGVGERVVVHDGGGPQYWSYDGGRLLTERDTTSTVRRYRYSTNSDPKCATLEIKDGSNYMYPALDQAANVTRLQTDIGGEFVTSKLYFNVPGERLAASFSPSTDERLQAQTPETSRLTTLSQQTNATPGGGVYYPGQALAIGGVGGGGQLIWRQSVPGTNLRPGELGLPPSVERGFQELPGALAGQGQGGGRTVTRPGGGHVLDAPGNPRRRPFRSPGDNYDPYDSGSAPYDEPLGNPRGKYAPAGTPSEREIVKWLEEYRLRGVNPPSLWDQAFPPAEKLPEPTEGYYKSPEEIAQEKAKQKEEDERPRHCCCHYHGLKSIDRLPQERGMDPDGKQCWIQPVAIEYSLRQKRTVGAQNRQCPASLCNERFPFSTTSFGSGLGRIYPHDVSPALEGTEAIAKDTRITAGGCEEPMRTQRLTRSTIIAKYNNGGLGDPGSLWHAPPWPPEKGSGPGYKPGMDADPKK